MRYFLTIIFIVCCNYTYAGSISGKVSSGSDVVPAATVSLLHAADSSWVASVISDDAGGFVFNDVAVGSYLVSVTSVGYRTGIINAVVTDAVAHPYIVMLEKESTTLGEATITARKPFIEMSLGKTVVNVENSTVAPGQTAFDLMRRLPGVTITQSGTIDMHGKQGVMVLVDDRELYLSGTDLVEYLKTITAAEVGQIELITQPGARYEAAGNTGIINIKLKKGRKPGLNGNLTGMYGMGVYFHRNESLLLNYRVKKLNLSLSGNDMEAIGFADLRQQLYYLDAATGSVLNKSDVHSASKERFSNTVMRVAADYDVTDKVKAGVSARGTYHPNETRGYILSANTDARGSGFNDVTDKNGFYREDALLNAWLTWKPGKESSLDVNLDHLSFRKNQQQALDMRNYDGMMKMTGIPSLLNSKLADAIEVNSARADYSCKPDSKTTLETGLKLSDVTTDNDYAYTRYDNTLQAWINDTGRTNRFVYKEQIAAVYTTLSRQLNKQWQAKAGLSAEQTDADGHQYSGGLSFTRSYLSLFPTVFIGYTADSSNTFELNYGRRIDRPSYEQLNPFAYYTFQYNYQRGNPALIPQYSNSIELKHSYKNMLISALEVSRTNNVITSVFQADKAANTIYSTFGNLSSNAGISCSLSFNKDLVKWWSVNASGSVYYAMSRTSVGKVKEKDWTAYWLNAGTRIDAGRQWSIEGFCSYNSAGWWNINSAYDHAIYMEVGVNKKINKQFLVNFFASDPFYLNRSGFHNYADNVRTDTRFRYASQLYSVSLTWTFGSSQSARHESKAIDEAGRIR